jgi:Sigma-70 region 2
MSQIARWVERQGPGKVVVSIPKASGGEGCSTRRPGGTLAAVEVEPRAGGDSDALVMRARDGDADAFRALVEAHWAELHAHCYRMLASYHDAEDAFQDALLRAWQALPGFEGRSSLRAWLYKIATNAALDVAKRSASLAWCPVSPRSGGHCSTWMLMPWMRRRAAGPSSAPPTAPGTRRAVAVDGKTLRGSGTADGPGRHLLAALEYLVADA